MQRKLLGFQPFDWLRMSGYLSTEAWLTGLENLVSLCRVRKPCLSVYVKALGIGGTF